MDGDCGPVVRWRDPCAIDGDGGSVVRWRDSRAVDIVADVDGDGGPVVRRGSVVDGDGGPLHYKNWGCGNVALWSQCLLRGGDGGGPLHYKIGVRRWS